MAKTIYLKKEEISLKSLQWKVLGLVLALLLGAAGPASAFEIGARVQYWFSAFEADIKADDGGVLGTTINAKDTLGIGNKAIPGFEAFIGGGNHRLTFGYTPLSYSGSSVLGREITFAGTTFSVHAPVNTELSIRMLDLEYQYTLLDMENLLAGFSLGAIGQIKFVDGEAKIASGGIQAKGTARLPLPMVGLGAHVGLLADILEARAKLTGISYSGHYLYEAQADISFTPFPFLDLHAGYRQISLRIDRDDLFVDGRFTGPYLGLTVSF